MTNESQSYLTGGVLVGLHHQKVGQYRSLERVTAFTTAILVVVIALAIFRGDGDSIPHDTYQVIAFPRFLGRLSESPPSSSKLSVGCIGSTRIVSDHGSVFCPKDLPESGLVHPRSYPPPGVFGSPHQVDSALLPLSTDSYFGLPDPLPLWRFTSRRLPAGISHEEIALVRPPQAILANPAWPPRVWLVDDTAVVEGYLTFHAHGLLSFELLSETHPGLGFAAAVRSAVDQSTCFPSIDKLGNRITVSCRYRCLFFQGGQSSVSVGRSITARIKTHKR